MHLIDERFVEEFGPTMSTMNEPNNSVTLGDGEVYLEVQAPYSKMILEGRKSIETRDYPLPSCLQGSKIYIFESTPTNSTSSSLGTVDEISAGLLIRGVCSFESSFIYESWQQWNDDRDKHCVPTDSKFEPTAEALTLKPKYGWIVQFRELFENTRETPVLKRIHRSFFHAEKTIILIRHAESVNNADKKNTFEAMYNMGGLKALPTLSQVSSAMSLLSIPMNTDLSPDGIQMAKNLRSRMEQDDSFLLSSPQLIVHSHLLRAQKTCQVRARMYCVHLQRNNEHIYHSSSNQITIYSYI